MESEPVDGQQLVQRLRELANQANAGDQQALYDLRIVLAQDRRLVDHLGDLTRHLETTLLERLAPDNVLTREAVREYLAQLRATLAGPHPTAIERLLVNQIALCYLADRHAAQLEVVAAGNPPLMAARAKRAESTQKRLLAAIKTLTTLRALAPHGLVPAKPDDRGQRPKLSA